MSAEAIDSLSRDEIEARLSSGPQARAALVRAGAEAGVAEAQAVYGQMLLDGGVERDAAEALLWFRRAAAQQHLMALNMVGRCYDLGWGTPVDKAKAAQCYRVAAQRGLDWAMYNYATLLTLGQGLAEDRAEALRWFEKAAALGNAKAINFIGSFHEDGWVVARDLDLAADCYRRAAEGGDFRGQFNHARMLIARGALELALHWLRRSAAGGTERFRAQAAEWLRVRAEPELNNAAALFSSSLSRSDGEGGVAARHAGGMPEGEARLRSSRWAKHGGGVDGADRFGSRSNLPNPRQLPLHPPSGGPPPPGFAAGRQAR